MRVYLELRAVVDIDPRLEKDLQSGDHEPLHRLTEGLLQSEVPLVWAAVDYIEPCSQVDTPYTEAEPGLSRVPAQFRVTGGEGHNPL